MARKPNADPKIYAELKPYVEQPEAELPEPLKALANDLMPGLSEDEPFPSYPWDELLPDQRLDLIHQAERQADPDLNVRDEILLSEIWEAERDMRKLDTYNPHPMELASYRQQQAKLRTRLEELEQERQNLWNSATATTPEAPPAPHAKPGPKGSRGPDALDELLLNVLLSLRKKLHREPTNQEVWNALEDQDADAIIDQKNDSGLHWTVSKSHRDSRHFLQRRTFDNRLAKLRHNQP